MHILILPIAAAPFGGFSLQGLPLGSCSTASPAAKASITQSGALA